MKNFHNLININNTIKIKIFKKIYIFENHIR